jgi:hypothetical protein
MAQNFNAKPMPIATNDYPDTETSLDASPAAAAPEPAPPDESEDEGGDSALLPKSLIGDVQVGATITLKVLHIYEDEVEVAPVEAASTAPTPMADAEAGLDKLTMSAGE